MEYGYGDQFPSGSYGQGGGGGGGGGEGGFMSEVGASQSGKTYNKSSLRPVTIKQLNDATQAYSDADFKIDDTEVAQVSFVGQIRNISQLSTFMTYKLDDGTGEIEVKKWLDNEERHEGDAMDTSDPTTGRTGKKELVVNGYAKVWGKLGSFSNNRRSVTAHVIRTLTNMDEYHCHFLEATAIHLYFKHGPPPSKDAADASKAQTSGSGGAMRSDNSMAAGERTLPPMSPMARKLFNTLNNTPQSREGLHLQHLASLMQAPVDNVEKAARELNDLSLIYPTVDDYTWTIMDFKVDMQ
ncbi:replication factor A2 [Coccidioides immitis RS]|uniref:Replication factor A2 n=3 Tax=Coccidioides immitis TaxID=5501 RepID=J3KGJ7_COCIM|nr:replication factor A2 [Coccidioides immitis RS]EAS34870.3 replication factor A2 [Coccidioides immitis RS]KMP00059.1 replication protein A 32 kDa subunit [Coccidioides immitis RMSCC 2394]KMU87185.1 replication protein A 32 kDa subunit [Coccidioides immitis H538.4]TPX26811.1 replication factor A protein 2 [Coccidioides immitis]